VKSESFAAAIPTTDGTAAANDSLFTLQYLFFKKTHNYLGCLVFFCIFASKETKT